MKKIQLKNPIIASIYQRISRLSLTMICFFALIYMGYNSSFQSHDILYKQSQITSRSLILQMSYWAKDAIKQRNKLQLHHIANDVIKVPYIHSAAIFDQYGTLLAKSDNSKLYQHHTDKQAMPGINKELTPLVESVFANGKRIGFVRISYESHKAMSAGHSYFHSLGRQIGIMLILCCVLTWLFARTIKRWQIKRYNRKVSQQVL